MLNNLRYHTSIGLPQVITDRGLADLLTRMGLNTPIVGTERKEYIKDNFIIPKDMPIPYISKDGREYYSFEALAQANAEYMERMFPKKTDI